MRRGWLVSAALLVVLIFVVSGCANKWLTSGKIAMNGKQYDKAIEDFNKVLEQNPENGEAHYYLAECYKEKGEYKKMLPHLDAAEKLYPKKKDKVGDLRKEAWSALFDSGRENAKNKKWDEAKSDFQTAIEVLPERFEAYTNLGYVWQHLGDNDSAYSYYSAAYDEAPDEMVVLENFASLCFTIGKYDKAKELYTKILTKDPKNAEAMARLGDIAGFDGKYQDAVNYYNQALEIQSNNCDLWFSLGVLYFQQIKDNDNAINAFSRTLELCPDDSNAFINLMVAYITAERFDEAIDKLSTFVEEYPDDCTGWDLYSQALLRKGQKSEALEAYKKYEACTGGK